MRPFQISDAVQELPETSNDDRMHVLDDTCWCHPTLAQEPVPGQPYRYGPRFTYRLTHRESAGVTPDASLSVCTTQPADETAE